MPWIPLGGAQVPIRGVAETPVGGAVCLLDRRAGTRCGMVTAKNQTINFPEGTITGLTRTTSACRRAAAIAFVSGDQAQGVPLGGTAAAHRRRQLLHAGQPVLAAYGLTLVTG